MILRECCYASSGIYTDFVTPPTTAAPNVVASIELQAQPCFFCCLRPLPSPPPPSPPLPSPSIVCRNMLEGEPPTVQRVWRVQREHAHEAWSKLFGDEALPQFGSAAEWTHWVTSERRQAARDMGYRLSAEVRAPTVVAIQPHRISCAALHSRLPHSSMHLLRVCCVVCAALPVAALPCRTGYAHACLANYGPCLALGHLRTVCQRATDGECKPVRSRFTRHSSRMVRSALGSYARDAARWRSRRTRDEPREQSCVGDSERGARTARHGHVAGSLHSRAQREADVSQQQTAACCHSGVYCCCRRRGRVRMVGLAASRAPGALMRLLRAGGLAPRLAGRAAAWSITWKFDARMISVNCHANLFVGLMV